MKSGAKRPFSGSPSAGPRKFSRQESPSAISIGVDNEKATRPPMAGHEIDRSRDPRKRQLETGRDNATTQNGTSGIRGTDHTRTDSCCPAVQRRKSSSTSRSPSSSGNPRIRPSELEQNRFFELFETISDDLSTCLTETATLKIRKMLAEDRLILAERAYDQNRDKFAFSIAIREKCTVDRDEATELVKQRSNELRQQEEQQKSIVFQLVNQIQQRNDKCSECTNGVSLAEHEKLRSEHQKLVSDHETQPQLLREQVDAALRQHKSEIKVQFEEFQKGISAQCHNIAKRYERSQNDERDAYASFDRKLSDIENRMDQHVKAIHERVDTLVDSAEDVKSRVTQASRLAGEARAAVRAAGNEIEEIRRTAEATKYRMHKELMQYELEAAEKTSKAMAGLERDIDRSRTDIVSLRAEVSDLKKRHDTLANTGVTEINQKLMEVTAGVSKADERVKKCEAAHEYHLAACNEVSGRQLNSSRGLYNEVKEDLHGLEKKVDLLNASVDSLKENTQSPETNANHAETSTYARGPFIDEHGNEQGTEVQREIESLKQELGKMIEGLDKATSSKAEKLELQTLAANVKHLQELYEKLKENAETWNESLKDFMRKRQAQVLPNAQPVNAHTQQANAQASIHPQTEGNTLQTLHNNLQARSSSLQIQQSNGQESSLFRRASVPCELVLRSETSMRSDAVRPMAPIADVSLPSENDEIRPFPVISGAQNTQTPREGQNNFVPTACSPVDDPSTCLRELAKDFKNLVANVNGWRNAQCVAIRNLKQRMDNLSTEELARQMLDQLSTVYPDLKDSNLAINGLKKDHGEFKQRVARKFYMGDKMNEGTSLAAQEARNIASALRVEIDDFKPHIAAISKLAVLEGQVEQMQAQIEAVSVSASASASASASSSALQARDERTVVGSPARLDSLAITLDEHSHVLEQGRALLDDHSRDLKIVGDSIASLTTKLLQFQTLATRLEPYLGAMGHLP